eukprot:TRINITY_DN25701_c0_g4_i1.p1 TRINITY_DN25701_c0_g4~~TRINITY_DN25701_c0_g4_i1.p1  ORF type:complete len:620 (-),score=117.29 TRINITY_DN25701_c0_g4_i1:128-1987(-)
MAPQPAQRTGSAARVGRLHQAGKDLAAGPAQAVAATASDASRRERSPRLTGKSASTTAVQAAPSLSRTVDLGRLWAGSANGGDGAAGSVAHAGPRRTRPLRAASSAMLAMSSAVDRAASSSRGSRPTTPTSPLTPSRVTPRQAHMRRYSTGCVTGAMACDDRFWPSRAGVTAAFGSECSDTLSEARGTCDVSEPPTPGVSSTPRVVTTPRTSLRPSPRSPGSPKSVASKSSGALTDVAASSASVLLATLTNGISAESRAPSSTLRGRRMSGRASQLKVEIPKAKALKEIRHLRPDQKIYDLYWWDKVLQKDGDGGKVVICRERKQDEGSPISPCSPCCGKDTGDEDSEEFKYVMKMRSKESLEQVYCLEQYRKTQLRMLNFPPHIGVMPLHEVLEDDKFFYVVAPKATGGSYLMSLLREFQDGVMPSSAVKKTMLDILQAVSHMHRCGVLHRDIKPDNLVTEVYEDPDSPTGKGSRPVFIDFDHADTDYSPLVPSPKQQECYGTLRFNAPETFLGHYSAQSDIYSVGAILYLLMTGRMPYNDDVFSNVDEWCSSPQSLQKFQQETFQSLQRSYIDWECDPWSAPEQASCKNFCQRLLAFDAKARFKSAEDALKHPWFHE